MSILISAETRFIVQGITGREAVNLTRENLAYGSVIVGGVTPGRAGRDGVLRPPRRGRDRSRIRKREAVAIAA